jgi:GDPmannose 4,6-dehydratase
MKKKIALITGVSGQDGSYLASFLLKKNYKVVGTDRRSARHNLWRLKYLNIEEKVIFEELELGEIYNIERVFKKYKFDEIYNLAAQSFVKSSFETPLNTASVTGLGVLRLLECVRMYAPNAKFYQASSSEMFGNASNNVQNENTIFKPQSPYAVSKIFGHNIVQNYRHAYKLFCVSGILFNHESPLRGDEFVTKKIVSELTQIYKGKKKILELGNINSRRDWGYAKDYVELMWKMLQQKKPEDFVIATEKTYSVKTFINLVTSKLGLKTKWTGKGLKEKLINKENNQVIIKIKPKFFRPSEVNYLKGDCTKAKKLLGWKNKTSLKKLIDIMVEYELSISNQN